MISLIVSIAILTGGGIIFGAIAGALWAPVAFIWIVLELRVTNGYFMDKQ